MRIVKYCIIFQQIFFLLFLYYLITWYYIDRKIWLNLMSLVSRVYKLDTNEEVVQEHCRQLMISKVDGITGRKVRRGRREKARLEAKGVTDAERGRNRTAGRRSHVLPRGRSARFVRTSMWANNAHFERAAARRTSLQPLYSVHVFMWPPWLRRWYSPSQRAVDSIEGCSTGRAVERR